MKTCKHDPACHDPFCSQDELRVQCATCGHRLGAHADYGCRERGRTGMCECLKFVDPVGDK